MSRRNSHQNIPSTGPKREALREKGQFWTPDWVAEAMVAYVLAGDCNHIFDPAVGEGAFFRAAKTIARETNRSINLLGTEIDYEALQQARTTGLSDTELANVQLADFVLHPPAGPYRAIAANPPYIRHHRLPADVKAQLREYGARLIGTPLDGRAGLHIYFLLRALQLLDRGGRLAFIMPADTCEGVFAETLWKWISRYYRLEAVVTFTPQASPFPGVDTNPVIFMIRNAEPVEQFLWTRCEAPGIADLKRWTLSGFTEPPRNAFRIHLRGLSEGLTTGLSRLPVEADTNCPTLLDYATVSRGIATGDNDFFFLTDVQVKVLGIPDKHFIRAIGRTRDVDSDEITQETLTTLEAKGRPTYLLALNGTPAEEFPMSVREYLKRGEAAGIHNKTLISTRTPWYKMEERAVPPFLFAYLGRRNARFIRNQAGVVPLTGFLCVYPRSQDPTFVDRLWQVLRHPATVANLALVGKSYGGGAIKVEPRALEKLPIPVSVIDEVGLERLQAIEQLSLDLNA